MAEVRDYRFWIAAESSESHLPRRSQVPESASLHLIQSISSAIPIADSLCIARSLNDGSMHARPGVHSQSSECYQSNSVQCQRAHFPSQGFGGGEGRVSARGDSLIPIPDACLPHAVQTSAIAKYLGPPLSFPHHFLPFRSYLANMLRPSLLRQAVRTGSLIRPAARAGPSVARPAALPLRPFSVSSR